MPENNEAAGAEQTGAATAAGATAAVAGQAEATPQKPEGVSDEAWNALGDPGKKAIISERARAAELEQRLTAATAKVTEFERAKLSDIERAQAEAQEAQAAVAKATTEALRWRTAAKFGISDEDAETFLTGADEASITKQAERLAAFKQATPAGPRADLSQAASRDGAAASGPEADFAKFLSGELSR